MSDESSDIMKGGDITAMLTLLEYCIRRNTYLEAYKYSTGIYHNIVKNKKLNKMKSVLIQNCMGGLIHNS